LITLHLKSIPFEVIEREKFGVLSGRQIHDAIGISHEAMHTIKTKNISTFVLKLLLIHVGFKLLFINWIKACIGSLSFVVLVNDSISRFFDFIT
jgi:hypothetical protein